MEQTKSALPKGELSAWYDLIVTPCSHEQAARICVLLEEFHWCEERPGVGGTPWRRRDR